MVAADGLGAHVPAQGQGTKDQVGGDRGCLKILLRWEYSFSINDGTKDFVL